MSELRPLRGGCQCGRNRYIIAFPQDGIQDAQVLFNTDPEHQIPLATPLAAYIRVPLDWYHSTTYAFFPDETHSLIRRVYTHPSHSHAKRHFCGYCGTPLSYWSEEPRSEANYIHLTIGSLLREDLRDLEDMGLIPDVAEPEGESHAQTTKTTTTPGDDDDKQMTTVSSSSAAAAPRPRRSTALRESYGVPWFDGLVEGTRLGKMRRSRGVQRSRDGQVNVQWEVVEYTDGNDDDDDKEDHDGDEDMDATTPGKRKRGSSDLAAEP